MAKQRTTSDGADCTARNGEAPATVNGRRKQAGAHESSQPAQAATARTESAPAGDSHPPAGGSFTRVELLELDRIQIHGRDAHDLLRAAMREYGHAANRMVRRWIMYHEGAGTLAKLERGEKCGAAVPGPLKKELYYLGCLAAPSIYRTSVQWLQQWLSSTLASKNSSRNNCKMWTAILRGNESPPCFTELPLRIYGSFAPLARQADGRLWVTTPLLRGPDGKYLPLSLRIRAPRNSQAAYQAINALAENIADGQARMQCSQIVRRGRKWFLALTVERVSEAPAVDAAKLLVLRPGNAAAWRGRYSGKSADVTDRPLAEVAHLSAAILAAQERAAHIDAQGLARGAPVVTGLRKKWRNAVTTFNHQITAEIAATVLKHRIGQVAICDGSDHCAVVMAAGGHYPREQFRRFLQSKLEPHGVIVRSKASFLSVKRRIKTSKRNKLAGDRVRAVAG